MKYYKTITFLENIERRKQLNRFGSLIGVYYRNLHFTLIGNNPVQNHASLAARRDISLIINYVYEIILSADISPQVRYTPGTATAGDAQDIDVILNYDNLGPFQIPNNTTCDFIRRTIGIYKRDFKRSLLRTFNPFFLIGCVLDGIAALPFAVFAIFGFNRPKAETSSIGKFIRELSRLAAVLTVILTMMHFFGCLALWQVFFHRILATHFPGL